MTNVYSGYGRTRRPKSLAGADATQSTIVNQAPDPIDATLGYPTENQRYLHLNLDTTVDNQNMTVTVYGFSYASGRWSPLVDVRGNAVVLEVNNNFRYQVFEISGVDRVYFNGTAALNATNFFFAAATTF